MAAPFSQKNLVDWAGPQVLREAASLVDNGQVLEAAYEPPCVVGAVQFNNRPLRTSLRVLADGSVESHCPCYANRERGVICAHVIALALTLIRRWTDPAREAKYQAEQRRAARLSAFPESAYLRRVPPGTPGAVPTRLHLLLGAGWQEGCQRGAVPLRVAVQCGGQTLRPDTVDRGLPLAFDRRDEAALYVLEDIAGGPLPAELPLRRADFLGLLRLLGGRPLARENGPPVTVNEAAMTTFLRMDMDPASGALTLRAHTELPFLHPPEPPFYIVEDRAGFAYGADNLWPLDNVLPGPYQGVYDAPVALARRDVLRFLQHELPLLAKQVRVETDLSLDLFTVDQAAPSWRLVVRGSPASLSVDLYARYGDIELVAGKPDARGFFGLPDPQDLMRYTVRNPEAERRALAALAEAGFTGERGDALSSIVSRRNVLNFLGSRLPSLRRRGWKIEFQGKVGPWLETMDFALPVVSVGGDARSGWFDIGFQFEDPHGTSLSHADIQTALRKGDAFLERGGRAILIDADAVTSMLGVFSDCESRDGDRPGHFRLPSVYAGFVKSSLDALDGVDVEAQPEWRIKAEQCNRGFRIEPVALVEPLARILRGYQKEGVQWLRFLEQCGFCGVLADEMGLGKTLQALAWLQLARCEPEAAGLPALVVCPTSLVENWAEEARRFAPTLRVLPLTGPDRHERRNEIDRTDLAITSYAILRRDLAFYVGRRFSVAVLDEAQHIKNRSTQNALAAKRLQAVHRVVLTGTPIENSVSDLWSIMDFLMPGYLGTHEAFRGNYELPIARGGPDADLAQLKLKRKMNPFLLRRLKTEVASDLPPRIEKIAHCSLSGDQQLVYQELLAASRRRLTQMVAARGFNGCRMEILSTLMRLRQVCCHLELLKLPGLAPQFPSGKLDLFFELLDEALDGGHRVLVFSQFVSMLKILRRELDARALAYCYLDGSTQERLSVVRRFNTERAIPVFLISLKAGGTGLNLTGADTVIHYDPWWNPAVENQATDRAHRIGQKRTVYSLKLITRDTVEEKVLALQQRKKTVIDATIESDKQIVQSLTWTDIQELLTL